LGLLLVLVALAGCEGTQAPPDQNRPADVDVSLPVKDTLRDYEVFTGRTQALNAVDLRARVTGYLAEVRFKEGQDVKKGDVLFVIQQDPFRDALAQSEATLSQQQAQLKYNEAIYQRNRILVGRQGVSQEDLEQSRANRDQYIAGVSGAEAAIKIARQNLQWTEIRAPFDGRISRRQVDPGNDVIADNTVLASLVELDKLYAYFDVD
jgi:RND family efflux transporter MFP subunit